MDIFNSTAALTCEAGVSGFERPVTRTALGFLQKYCDRTYTTVHGSAVGIIDGCGGKLMIDAHIDRVGFAVSGFRDGFLTLTQCGTSDPRVLAGKKVTVHAKTRLEGVFASIPPHLTAEEGSAIPPVDIGFSDKRARELVSIGDTVTVDYPACRLLNGRFASPALDDRACFASVLYALELLGGEKPKYSLYIVGSTLEESTGAGAAYAAEGIMPDEAIIADVDHAFTPDSKAGRTMPLGEGVGISKGPHLNRELTDRLMKTAQNAKIPYTVRIEAGNTGTNATGVRLAALGIPTALIDLPLRYMHTPSEVCSEGDQLMLGRLIYEYIRS